MNQVAKVGSLSYQAHKAVWFDRIPTVGDYVYTPKIKFLAIRVGVRNDDSEPKRLPPVFLLDENNNRFVATSAPLFEGELDSYTTLNPTLIESGIVFFDVPQGRKYRLLVSGESPAENLAAIEIIDSDELDRRQAALDAEEEKVAAEAKAELEAQKKAADDKRKWRKWQSADGKSTVYAAFVRAGAGVVTLKRENGSLIEVRSEKLSQADRDFISSKGWLRKTKVAQ
jgi:hypothetical protein